MLKTDVAIIGGGPAGCFLGKTLAENGVEVTIIEEHPQVGNPSCCAGVVGAKGLQELGISDGSWVLDKLDKTKIYPPSGEAVEIGRGKSEALVIDRAEFDRWLARGAARAGANFLLKTKCVDLKLGANPTLKVKGEIDGEIEAKLIVGADGPASVVARKIGLPKSERFIRCAQVEVTGKIPKKTAEIYLGHDVSPGFFGWGFNAGGTCRVGLGCTDGNPVGLLRKFLSGPKISKRIRQSGELQFCSGIIPQAFSRKIQSEGVLLVGDAAGQVKPLTGGGIYPGLACSKMASEAIAEFMEKNDQKTLQNYPHEVKKKFGLEVELASRARRVFEGMSDEDLDQLVALLGQEDVRGIVERNLEFDRHGKLIQALIPKLPKILKRAGAKRLFKFAKAFLK